MMPTTTISSIRVKARRNDGCRMTNDELMPKPYDEAHTPLHAIRHGNFLRHSSFGFRPSRGADSRLLLQAGDDADERREERKHDRADDHRQEHDHDRFQHRGESGHSVIDLVIVHVRDL